MVAIARRNTGAAAQLLGLRADPNLRDKDGRDALMYAAEYGDVKTAARLLAIRPQLQTNQDNAGATALRIAEDADQSEMRSLLDRPASSEQMLKADGQLGRLCGWRACMANVMELLRGHPELLRGAPADDEQLDRKRAGSL